MKFLSILATLVAGMLVANRASAEDLKSGLQVGERIPAAFHPFNINGPEAGKKSCLVCRAGICPTAMIFAREPDANLIQLIKQLDKAAVANKAIEMYAFVVFCTDDKDLEGKLKAIAEKESLKELVLATDNPAGPKGYKLDKEAAVTVVLYNEREIKANFAFKKGELKAADIEKIVKDLSKITK